MSPAVGTLRPVLRFRAGEVAPDWLLTVEPGAPATKRGELRLRVDVDVVELESGYLVFPLTADPGGMFDLHAAPDAQVVASGRRVAAITAWLNFPGPDGWVGPIGEATPPADRQAIAQVHAQRLALALAASLDPQDHQLLSALERWREGESA